MSADFVWLHATVVLIPPVDACWTIAAWPDAVTPVICFCKTSARPTQHAGVDCLEGFNQRFPESVDVGNRRVFADPDAVVENAADVFGEMPVDKRIDDADRKRIDQIEFLHGRVSG